MVICTIITFLVTCVAVAVNAITFNLGITAHISPMFENSLRKSLPLERVQDAIIPHLTNTHQSLEH